MLVQLQKLNTNRLDGIMLHFLAVQQAMVSIHEPIHLKTLSSPSLVNILLYTTSKGLLNEIQ